MLNVKTPIRYTAALTLFVSALAFASPAFAVATDQDTPPDSAMDNAPAPQEQPAPPPAPMHHNMMQGDKMHHDKAAMNVETRIKTLHDKLMLKPDQEHDWQAVAQDMRDNEAKIHQLITARHENPDNMTAVDDLQSYQQITQAHADGLQKLTTDFGTLYNGMSDAQKKNADMVFGKFEGHRDDAPAKKHG
jgi:hypothetical protein